MISTFLHVSENPRTMKVLELYQDTLKGLSPEFPIKVVKSTTATLTVPDDVDAIIADGSDRKNFDEVLDYTTSKALTIGWFVKNPNKYERAGFESYPHNFISNIPDLEHVELDDFQFIFHAGANMDRLAHESSSPSAVSKRQRSDGTPDSSPSPKRREVPEFVESALSKMRRVSHSKERLYVTLKQDRSSAAAAEQAVSVAGATLSAAKAAVVSAEQALAAANATMTAAKTKAAETSERYARLVKKADAMAQKETEVLALMQSLHDVCDNL